MVAIGNVGGLLEFAVVLGGLGSELGFLFLELALWRLLRCAKIAVVDWFVGGGTVVTCAVEASSSS